MTTHVALTVDQIEQELVRGEALIARIRAEQVRLLAEADRLQVATADGCRTLAEWTASRLDVAPETARRLVRLARHCTERPAITERLTDGEWSFDRTVEADRWIDAGADLSTVLADAPRFDVAGLRSRVAMTRRLTPTDEAAAFDGRYLVTQRTLDRTRMRLWGELPGDDGDRVESTLSTVADTFPPLPDGSRPTRSQRMADALVAVTTNHHTTTTIGTGTHTGPSAGPPSGPQAVISVFVDRGAAHTAGGYVVGDGVIDELLCDAHVEHTDLGPTGARELGGRNTVTDRQRRRIRHRDKVCGADGCTTRHRLQVHHRRHQAHGGGHDDDNLVLLCWYHHHIVIHRHGFTIDPTSPPGRLRFHRPHHPPQRE